MKRLLALLLTVCLTLSLAACGGTQTPEVPTTPELPAAPETPAVPETPETPAEQEPMLPEPDWTEPVYNMEETVELRQKALLEMAMAYYNKGVFMQYDRGDVSNLDSNDGGPLRGKTLEANTPEEATKDLTLYQVCSSFLYDITYHSMGYRLLDTVNNCVTKKLSQGMGDDSLVIFQIENTTATGQEKAAALRTVLGLLQPGDFIIYYSDSHGSGHSVLYLGDHDGDGAVSFMESGGKKYKYDTGVDVLEETGTHLIQPISYNFGESSSQFLGKMSRYAVYRMTNLDPAKYPLTNAVKARLTYPGLRIDRTVEGGYYGSVEAGGELTYTIEVTNCSAQDYTGIPVMDKVADNCRLLSVDGADAQFRHPTWDVSVKAGQTVTLSYTVRVCADAVDAVVSAGGSFAGIPMNTLTTTIQHFTPDSSALTTAAENAAAKGLTDIAFVNAVYAEACGVDTGLTDTASLLGAHFTAEKRIATDYSKGGTYYWPDRKNAGMIVPLYYGGRWVPTAEGQRNFEPRICDLQAGDIIVIAQSGLQEKSPVETAWIYDGEAVLSAQNGSIVKVDQTEFTKLMMYDFYAVVRPSLTQSK